MAFLHKRNKTYSNRHAVGSNQPQDRFTPDRQRKLRRYESSKLQGLDSPLPTRTLIADVVSAYVQYIRTVKTPKSAQTDIYYLRQTFGSICKALEITSRRLDRNVSDRVQRDNRDSDRHRDPFLIFGPVNVRESLWVDPPGGSEVLGMCS